MGYNTSSDDGTGPQGTQAFDASEINQMIAEEIIQAQSALASTPALVGLNGDLVGEVLLLEKDTLTIGRGTDNDIVLTQASVSSSHVKMRNTDDGWKVLNLLSSNGTYVNGKKISEKIIRTGDRLTLAEAEFIFALVDEKPGNSDSKLRYWLTIITVGIALIVFVYLALLNS